MKIILAIIIFGIIVFIHEMGHFLFAKASGITVLEFAVGMGPRLFSVQGKETRYSIKIIPFGGMCVMKGEDLEDTSPGSFQSVSVWKRFVVVAAGPIFNFLLAFILACIMLLMSGVDVPYISQVQENSPAAEAGLEDGDQILRYQGNGIANARELATDIRLDGIPKDQIKLTILRGNEKKTVSFKPEKKTIWLFGFTKGEDTSGAFMISSVVKGSPMEKAGAKAGDLVVSVNGTKISSMADYDAWIRSHPLDGSETEFELQRDGKSLTIQVTPEKQEQAEFGFSVDQREVKSTFLSIWKDAFGEISYWVHLTFRSIGGLISGMFSVNDLSGPVGIVQTIDQAYTDASQYGIQEIVITMLGMSIFLSISLGVMNLLPLPALDGGRLVFLLIEGIRRKPLNRKFEGYVHTVGFLLLMALMVFVCYNDIRRIFFN